MTGPGSLPSRADPDPFEDPIATAIVDVVAERGYQATTVEDLIERAGVTREEFERRFASKDDCALKVFEAFTADYERRIGNAYDAYPDWRTGLRAAAYECAAWMLENPNLVRFGAVDLLAAESEMIRVRREEAMQYGASLIDRGRAEAVDPAAISDATAVMAVGSIVHLLSHRIQGGGDITPKQMIPQMMYLAVRPYVGEEAAREELTMPPPKP